MAKTMADPTILATHMSELADKRIDILRRIADVGSISEAARRAGVSYKAAWQAIETLGNIAGGPLVEKVVGGSKGGGTRLTATGEEVLHIADELTRARAEVDEKVTDIIVTLELGGTKADLDRMLSEI